MRPRRNEVTLERYMNFLENPHCHEITNTCLNQIIWMHGFRKLHRRPKVVLLDTLNTMSLVPPNRSSLRESVSSCASLTTEEVIRDLDLLDWKECSPQSIQTLNSSSTSPIVVQEEDNNMNAAAAYCGGKVLNKAQKIVGVGVGVGVGVVKKTGKRKTRRKKSSVRALCFLAPPPRRSDAVTTIAATSGDPSPAPSIGSADSSYWLGY